MTVSARVGCFEVENTNGDKLGSGTERGPAFLWELRKHPLTSFAKVGPLLSPEVRDFPQGYLSWRPEATTSEAAVIRVSDLAPCDEGASG